MKSSIDLNADLGEGFPNDGALLAIVTSANVSCGAHAGTNDEIRETLRLAKKHGVVVGAHPGYADRANFGRIEQSVSEGEVRRLVLDQVTQLAALAVPLDISIQYIKPHGALYNQAQTSASIAMGIADAANSLRLPVVGLPDSQVAVAAKRCGIHFVAEGFVDRGYEHDGRLRPRTHSDALLRDPRQIVSQTLALVGAVPDSEPFLLLESLWRSVETLCVHGDSPEAVEIARLVRAVLRLSHVSLHSFIF